MIGAWLVLTALAVASLSVLLSSGITSNMEFRGSKPASLIGQNLVEKRLTGPQKMTDFVIVRSATLKTSDPIFQGYVESLSARIADLGPGVVQSVSSVYTTHDRTLVSKDGRGALLPVVMAGDQDTAMKNVASLHAVVVANAGYGFTLAQTGDASLNQMITQVAKSDMEKAEIFGVPAALIVLVIVFGALVAAGMPLLLSIVSIILALAITGLIGQIYPMNTFVLNILTMMGLAVGIDYTLFVISRYREERARGLAKIDAIAATGATANRAIFFSGMTVFMAMLGMVIVPLDITISMGLGVMLVVFTTLLTTLILLPALLGALGDHVNSLRVPVVGRLAMNRAAGGVGPVRAARAQHHAPPRGVAHRGRRDSAHAGLTGPRHEDRQHQHDGSLPARRPVFQAGLGHPRARLLAGQGQPAADRLRRPGGGAPGQAGRRPSRGGHAQ